MPCPELEALDQHASDPAGSPPMLTAHVSGCLDCQARISELSQNLALFAEMGSAAPALRNSFAAAAEMPRQIGEFQIVREIGRGGMGVVYEARQQRPERQVALKLLRPDYAASDERRRLFEREIKVLARLRHEGITAIFESGGSKAGPYYAMELVGGGTLAEYVQRTRPDLRQTLRLFLKVCAAITYAHQRGIIHRDIKPGNILVEGSGAPKVLDFGLARITDGNTNGPSLAMHVGKLVGTLAYMSPEQVRGVADEIDLRSDVYALGVLLFELLTGALPYDVSPTSVQAAMHTVLTAAPRRPSSVTGARLSAPALQGDLDTIVHKALEKHPPARYQSVAALAEDIERFLWHQPIIARPATTYYQIRKFARRHRAAVIGAVSVVVALAIGMAAAGMQAVRARAAEKRALAEAATTEEVNRFLTTMFASVDPALQGPEVRVVQMLERAAKNMDGAFAGQPLVAIALRQAIGGAYKSLTLYAEAAPQFERGVELANKHLGPTARETLRLQYGLAEASAHNGKAPEAMETLAHLLRMQTTHLGADDPDTLTTRHFLAVLHAEAGRLEEAVSQLRETLAGRMRALGAEHDETLDSMASLGIACQRQGDMVEAGKHLRQAHATSLRVHGPDHAKTLALAGNVATLARTPAELEAVEPLYRDIVARGTRVFGPTHQQTLAFMDALGQLLELRCRFAEAIDVTSDQAQRLAKAVGERDPRTLACLSSLARRMACDKRHAEAEQLNRQVLSACREVFGENDSHTGDALFDLAQTLYAANHRSEALAVASECLTTRAAIHGDSAAETALARSFMGSVLRGLSRLDDAHLATDRALRDLRALPQTEEAFIAWAECNHGTCLRDQKQFAQAEPILRHGRERLVAIIGECNPICVDATAQLAQLYRDWHEQDPGGGHDRQAAALNKPP